MPLHVPLSQEIVLRHCSHDYVRRSFPFLLFKRHFSQDFYIVQCVPQKTNTQIHGHIRGYKEFAGHSSGKSICDTSRWRHGVFISKVRRDSEVAPNRDCSQTPERKRKKMPSRHFSPSCATIAVRRRVAGAPSNRRGALPGKHRHASKRPGGVYTSKLHTRCAKKCDN